MERFGLRSFQDDKPCVYFFSNVEFMTATIAPIETTSFLVADEAKRRPLPKRYSGEREKAPYKKFQIHFLKKLIIFFSKYKG